MVFKFLPILESFLMAGEIQRPRQSHYASDANACRRQLVYSWRNTPWTNPNTPGGKLKMEFGNMAEKSLVENALTWAMANHTVITDFATQIRREVQIDGLKHMIVTKLDFLITLTDKRVMILELKSSYGRGIKQIQLHGPKDDHLVQVLFYLTYNPQKVATLVYLGRDNGYRTEFEVALIDKGLLVDGRLLDTEFYNMSRFIERFKFVEACLAADRLPDRDYQVAIKNGEIKDDGFSQGGVTYKCDWQCSYCRWRDDCWKDELPKYAKGNNSAEFKAVVE